MTPRPEYAPMPQCVCGAIRREYNDKYDACAFAAQQEYEAQQEREQRIRNVTDAIERFVDANLALFGASMGDTDTKHQRDELAYSREHMRDKLRELLP